MTSAPPLSGLARSLRPPSARTLRRFVLTLGLALALLQPPFVAGEEREQMALLEELARLEFTSPSDAAGPFHQVDAELERLASHYEAIPRSWRARVSAETLFEDLRAKEGERDTVRMARAPTPRLGRLASLPLLPGYWLGSALGLSTLAQLYLARLTGLACFALLASYAVSNAGSLAFALFALSALPGSLAQAASVSGEGLCSGLALCFFALLGKGRLAEGGLDERERIALVALLLALSMCQPLFASAALFLLALPADAPVRPLLRGGRLCALGCALGVVGVTLWLCTNPPATSSVAGATFARAHALAALLGAVRGAEQLDSLLIALSAFSGPLVDQARFSAGVIAALGGELLVLLAWGAAASAHGAQVARGGLRWLVAGSLVYMSLLVLWRQLTQTSAGPLELDVLSARSFALIAPAGLLLLSAYGKPSLLRFLAARPATRITLPLVILNAVALSALLGRYFVPAKFAWPY